MFLLAFKMEFVINILFLNYEKDSQNIINGGKPLVYMVIIFKIKINTL